MTLGPIDEEGIREMQERYAALDPSDKKIVEEEEDKLLSTLIYNFTAYMVMMEVIIVCNRGFHLNWLLLVNVVIHSLSQCIFCLNISRYQRMKSREKFEG